MQTIKSSPALPCPGYPKRVLQYLLILVCSILTVHQTALSQANTCATATSLSVVNASTCTASTTFNTNGGGTGASFSSCATGGGGYNWAKFVANSSTAYISYNPASNRDAVLFAYRGTCGSLTQIGCVDAAGNGGTETLTLTGLTSNTTYYIVVVRYGNSGGMNGSICVASPYTITTGSISGSPFCGNATISVPFTSQGTFSGNTYSVELSNAAGSFASPTTIGSLTSNANSGTISATLPSTASGTGYRIRVVSNGPAVTGSDNGTNLTINPQPQGSLSGNTICGSGTPQLTFTASSGTGPYTVVYNDGLLDRTKTNVTSGVAFTPALTPLITTTYTLKTVTDSKGCSRNSGFAGGTGTITFASVPSMTAAATATSICFSSSAQTSSLSYILTTGSPNSYAVQWNAAALADGMVNSGSMPITSGALSIPVAAGVPAKTYTGTIILTNASGCNSTGNSFTLTVNPAPAISGSLTACTGSTTQLTGTGTPDLSSPWVSSNTAVATVNTTGLVTGIAAGSSTITYTNIQGCSTSSTVTINTSPDAVVINPVSATTCNMAIKMLSAINYAGSSPQVASTGTISVSIPDNIPAGATSLLNVSGIPSTATVTGIAVNFNITHTYNSDLIVNLKAPNGSVLNMVNRRGGSSNNFTNTTISSTASAGLGSGSAPYTGTFVPDAATGIGATGYSSDAASFSSLYSSPNGDWIFSVRDAVGGDNGTITGWSITITYTVPAVTWTTNTTALYTNAAATVAYVAQNTATVYAKPATTQTYTATATASNGCTSSNSVTVTVTSPPSITASPSATAVCYSAAAQNSSISYSAVTGSPAEYSIVWGATALAAGLVNTGNQPLTYGSLDIPVAAGVPANSYTGTLYVSNTNCSSTGSSFTLVIKQAPGITSASAAASLCYSSAAQTGTITYSGTSASPVSYAITWSAAAQSAGLVNTGSTAITTSPLSFPIAAGIVPGTYNGTLTVTNALGCSNTGNSFTQQIIAPSINASSAAAALCTSAGAQTSSIAYSATTGSPVQYKIVWNYAAQSAGLVSTSYAAITGSPLAIPVAAGVPGGTYSGTLYVKDAGGCESVGSAFTLSLAASAPVMTSAAAISSCSGSSVNLALAASVPANFTWIAASNANVTGESTTLQTASVLNDILTLSVPSVQSVVYTVTPTSTGGCAGISQTLTVTVNPTPTITTAATTTARCYNTNTQTTALTYSATTFSPTHYNIVWSPGALSAGFINTGINTLPAGQVSILIPAGTPPNTYTGTLYVRNAAGCISSGNSFTLTINPQISITVQPADKTVCSGSSTTLSVTATGTSLSYQWRKGTINLCNCSNLSGVTTSTLTINPVSATDAVSNYNCVVSGGGCSAVISDYAAITVNTATAAPATLPKDLVFPTVNITSVLGSFNAASDATNYLVIRKTTNVAPTNPSNGTTYTLNSTILTGTVDYVGTNNYFTSNGLTPGTTYYYWIFPYNVSACGTSPLYNTTTPLTGTVTTATNVACGTVTKLYWAGRGSSISGSTTGTDFNTAANWSTSSSSYVASPSVPSECNDVRVSLTSSATITLSDNISVYGFDFTVGGSGRKAILSVNGYTLTVNSNATVDVTSGDSTTNIYLGEYSSGSGVVDFKANFKLGETYFTGSTNAAVPRSYLIGNENSKIIFRGDVLIGRTARFVLPGNTTYPPSYPLPAPGTATTPGTILFDGAGLQQVLWNNNVWYDCFYNIVVGEDNHPYVKHVTGTYTPDNILNNLTINDGATVDLGSSQWIREQFGGKFTMNGSAKLILGNNQSVRSSANTGIRVTGSNFPGGFGTMDISPNSTIEYNGDNSITQTVYADPNYGNVVLSNSSGSGTAAKVSTGTFTVYGTLSVEDKTRFTPGANITVEGAGAVNSGGTWACGTNVVSGNGSFTVNNGGTLTIGSAAGITASGATGNIQTNGGRIFNTGANYTYNGSTAQDAGSGLPTTVNNLTISNAAGVTMYPASVNYTVAGTLALTSGALRLNGDSLTINSLTRSSGTFTGSSTSSIGVTGTSIPLFFTSGGRVLKNLFVNNNASADIQTALDITAGSGAGSISVGSGATLNTHGFLTLKSDANGTARVAPIPVDGSGNALGNITGNVTIERYIPAKRSWRLVSAPVQSSGSQTINQAWQEGSVNYDLNNNLNPVPGFGVHISGSSPSLGFDATPLNNPSLKVFTRSNSSWTGIANTNATNVTDYEGYMLFVRGNRSTNLNMNTGAPLSNTVIRETGGIRRGRQPISLPGGSGSYSVVGNPYPSSIDLRTLSVTGAGSTKNFVIWDPALTGTNGVGAYQYLTQSAGDGSDYLIFPGGGSYGTAGSVYNSIESGQAFLVQNAGAATLYFNESSKLSSSTSAVFRPVPDNITGKISTVLYGVEADSSLTVLDGGLTLYRSEFSDELDLEDAKKINNTSSENFGINKGTAIYAIEKRQTIEERDTIQYSMRNLKARTYQLVVELTNMEATGMTAYLKDRYTGTVTTLSYNEPYRFTFTPTNPEPGSYAPDRFLIYFKEMNVVPVSFVSIDAWRKNKTAVIDWKVQEETNVHHYEVERSADGQQFTKIGTVTATNSNVYQLIDEQPVTGLNYYRVRAVINNRTLYTPVAKVFFGRNASGITIFPNPVVDRKINLYINGGQKGDYTINLFNNSGQLLKSEKLAQSTGNGNRIIEMDNVLPHGTYYLEIIKPDMTKQNISFLY